MDATSSPLRALALNCTLKASPADSSTDRMIGLIRDELGTYGVETEVIRMADHRIEPGVTSNEGPDDEWPSIRSKILEADIFLLATPVWLGNPSSICRRVLERLDAFLGETDEDGRPIAYDRVAIAATVGNEDGAHNVSAQVFQGLDDVGFTLPAGGHAYWVGEAMQKVDFQDLDEVPEKVTATVKALAQNAVHLAALLAAAPYPKST